MYSKETNTKVCPTCETPKDIDTEFYKRSGGGPGSHCKDCTKKKLIKWAVDNPEKAEQSRIKAQQTAKQAGKTAFWNWRRIQTLRSECLQKLGGKCAWREGCDWIDPRALQIDHVYGGGGEDRRSVNGNLTAFYRKVLADTTGMYQLLCANHNWIKRCEERESGERGWDYSIPL